VLDAFEKLILRVLQRDGRASTQALSDAVGLSPSPCWRRVKALEDGGYISGYYARINRHKVGLGVLAFVRLNAERNNGFAARELEAAIALVPQIVSCHYISGTGTFELQVVAANLEAFASLAREVLLDLPHVKDIHTSFSLGEVTISDGVPLGHLLLKK
jgi:DNA-binding Lrp family transcriptional regulator